ncbi:MAG TPA: hypothetical protein VHC22_22900 [Pirellulales bacterium]|nr:hypothetical protein [Pirellulales bacterium]
MGRRLQFSLCTLLVIVTVSAFGVHWCASWYGTWRWQRIAAAEHELDGVWRFGTIETGTDNDAVHDASMKLLRTREAMPFTITRSAYAEHLMRMEALEKMWRARNLDLQADEAHVFVEEAQGLLDAAP